MENNYQGQNQGQNQNQGQQYNQGRQDTEFAAIGAAAQVTPLPNQSLINPVARNLMDQDQEGRRPDSRRGSSNRGQQNHPTEAEVMQQGMPVNQNMTGMQNPNQQNQNTSGTGRNNILTEGGQEVSFRGKPIPIVERRQPYTIANSDEVIEKAKSMTSQDLSSFTIVAIHLDNRQISEVKLSTGEVIDVETAIALADNDYLRGFSTGATMKGGRTLRTKPSPDDAMKNGIYDLPRF